MNKSIINTKVIKKSVGLKIMLGMILMLGMFFVLAYGFISVENYQQNIVKQLLNATSNETVFQEIDLGVTDIQRNIAIYSATGSPTILEKIRQTQTDLNQSLNLVLKKTSSREEKEEIKNLQHILNRYEENIIELEKRYNFRKTLLGDSLTRLKEKGGASIKQLFGSSTSTPLKENYSQILIHWFEMFIHANEFLNTKDYSSKIEINKHIKEAKNNIKFIQKRGDTTNAQKVSRLLNNFKEVFDQSVQANRLYLSLVNVVIAGDTAEFLYLSQSLKDRSKKQVITLMGNREIVYKDSISIVYFLMIISLAVLVFIAIFYRNNIVNALKEIEITFNNFLQGDFSQTVPHLNRQDEIGNLAKAAEEFKKVNKEMIKAKDTAERLAKSKSEFLANMSHEIRTPMNGILGMAELLNSSKLTNEQKQMLTTINSCGESLLTILNDVLDFSKIESGNIQIEHRDFNLKNMISEVYYLFEQRALEKSIILDLKILNPDFPQFVRGDITRIKQILINLLSNAIKFTSEGTVTLSAQSKQWNDTHYRLKFDVIDTGVGITKEASKHLFQAFTQADSSITRKFGGTGLGLTISKQLAELMGGRLNFVSEYGSGTTFSFELEIELGKEITSKEVDIINSSPYQGLGIRALVVEDNPVNIAVAKKYLEKAGIEVDVATNGVDAINLVKNKKYSLIFMDMQMPIMDGITATKEIRALPQNVSTPIIAMTANAFDEDKKSCFDAGMDDFIPKPLSYKKIFDAVSRVISSSEGNEK